MLDHVPPPSRTSKLARQTHPVTKTFSPTPASRKYHPNFDLHASVNLAVQRNFIKLWVSGFSVPAYPLHSFSHERADSLLHHH